MMFMVYRRQIQKRLKFPGLQMQKRAHLMGGRVGLFLRAANRCYPAY